MRESLKQFSIVTGDTAQDFEFKLNAISEKLHDNKPTFTFNADLTRCKVEYEKTIEISEPSPAEVGVRFVCADCPHFEPELNRDGSVDMRKKFGGCKYALMNRTFKDSSACEVLYTAIKNGEVGLCLTE